MHICNHPVRICNHRVSICNHPVGVDRQLGLAGGLLSSHIPNKTDRTYIEDVKNPDKVIPPSRDLVLICLRVEHLGDHIPLAQLNDLPLNLCDHSVIGASVSGLLRARIVGITHAVSCSIAPRTDWLSASNRIPLNPRSRA